MLYICDISLQTNIAENFVTAKIVFIYKSKQNNYMQGSGSATIKTDNFYNGCCYFQ